MRITFSNIPTEPNKTYTFASNLLVGDIKFCLDRDNVTYEYYGRKDFDKVLPKNIQIPVVLSMPLPGAARICEKPAVFITNLNTTEFLNRIEQIARREDDELEQIRKATNERIRKSYQESYSDLTGVPVSKRE